MVSFTQENKAEGKPSKVFLKRDSLCWEMMEFLRQILKGQFLGEKKIEEAGFVARVMFE
jgi:hypothetical protein